MEYAFYGWQKTESQLILNKKKYHLCKMNIGENLEIKIYHFSFVCSTFIASYSTTT